MTESIDLTAAQRNTLLALLRQYLPGVAIWAYGSRVQWTSRPNSDLDLVVFSTPAQGRQVGDLKDALAESNLPFPVDLHVWDDVPERFREIIQKEYVVLQEARQPLQQSGMAGGWRERPLVDLVEIFDGPHATPVKTQVGPIFLGISNLAQGRLNLNEVEHLSEDDYVRWTRRVEPRAGDIVFSYETRLGEAAIISPGLRCCLGRRMGLLRARRGEIDERFLLYAYLGPQFQDTLRARTVPGSTVDRIPLIDMPQFQMVVPTDPNEQRAIAHILGTLDDKIELNRRMNETLEAMARALFKSWFIDFDPVRRNAARARNQPSPPRPSPSGRGEQGEGVIEGSAFDHLFPSRLVDSELGEIPEGWKLVLLPDAVAVNPARSLQKGVSAPYLDMANMPTSGHTPDAVVDRPFGSGMRFTNGDTLVARITPCLENGKTAFVDFLADGQVGWGSTEYIVLRPKPPLPEEFAYCLARSDEFRDFAIQSMTGTSGRQRVPPEALSHYRLVVPSEPVAALFRRMVRPLFAKASHASRESRALIALRDTLLPKLISGELRVKDAERFCERAEA